MIGIINYKAGNTKSVSYALTALNLPHIFLEKDTDFITNLTAIVLPGVGSAKSTLDSLKKQNLWKVLTKFVLQEKKFFLGICVGLQILFEHSEEEDTSCLNFLDGKVLRFDGDKHGIKVPQMGWNEVAFDKKKISERVFATSLQTGMLQTELDKTFAIIEASPYFYFVNSYYAEPKNSDMTIGITQYGAPFAAMVWHENICATQFHLEKSGASGLALLRFLLRVPATFYKKRQ